MRSSRLLRQALKPPLLLKYLNRYGRRSVIRTWRWLAGGPADRGAVVLGEMAGGSRSGL